MGGSDRYCAICGTSIGISRMDIGSSSERAKRIRKEIIELGVRGRDGHRGEDNYSDSESDLSDSHEQRFDIERGYDPEVMENRDTTLPNYDRFHDHVRLVVCDPAIKSSSKCFISGEAHPDSFGWGTVNGGHPERPDEEFENVMYMEYEPDQTKAFPCHGLCLQIAAKVILNNPSSRLLNPDVLYKSMCDVHEGGAAALNLNYGDFEGASQFWDCYVGEEFCIMNPLEFYRLHMQTVAHLKVEHEQSDEDIGSISIQKPITDPFQKLSNELIHHVTHYLEGKDVFRLRQVSMIVREATSGNSFWMPRVQEDLRFLWVPHDLFTKEAGGSSPIDWMKVYLLFDSATAKPWGMRGVYTALANRRRIWNVCERLKLLYMSHIAESGQPLTNPNPGRRTWGSSSEIDSMWSEPLDMLESYEQWLK